MFKNLASSLPLFVKKGLPVVIYRLPGESMPVLIAKKTRGLEEIKISEIDKISGFVVSGFEQSVTGQAFVIKPDIFVSQTLVPQRILTEIEVLPNAPPVYQRGIEKQSKSSYIKMVNKAIGEMESGAFQKVVLSRMLKKETAVDILKFYSLLEQKYPDAFVYLLHLPQVGTWAGASPETLLSISDNFAETIALAGTVPVNNIDWTNKEEEEQQLVSDYIEASLNAGQIHDFQKTGPVSIQAGRLAHLKTSFSIPIANLQAKIGSFVHQLHPTPAVCGLPKQKAYEFIQQNEHYDRELYTGFLGPWNLHNKSHLFVNLRCARLEASAVQIFVGGGITAKSTAEAEWVETVNKSQTLLSVLKNM